MPHDSDTRSFIEMYLLEALRADPRLEEDARDPRHKGETLVGGAAFLLYPSKRAAIEELVGEALATLDRERSAS